MIAVATENSSATDSSSIGIAAGRMLADFDGAVSAPATVTVAAADAETATEAVVAAKVSCFLIPNSKC